MRPRSVAAEGGESDRGPHVLLRFLALLLVRVAEQATHQPWPQVRRELHRVALVDLGGPAGQVSQRTELTSAPAAFFEALPPTRIWAAASSAPAPPA